MGSRIGLRAPTAAAAAHLEDARVLSEELQHQRERAWAERGASLRRLREASAPRVTQGHGDACAAALAARPMHAIQRPSSARTKPARAWR